MQANGQVRESGMRRGCYISFEARALASACCAEFTKVRREPLEPAQDGFRRVRVVAARREPTGFRHAIGGRRKNLVDLCFLRPHCSAGQLERQRSAIPIPRTGIE
jgi:hypothetical protein